MLSPDGKIISCREDDDNDNSDVDGNDGDAGNNSSSSSSNDHHLRRLSSGSLLLGRLPFLVSFSIPLLITVLGFSTATWWLPPPSEASSSFSIASGSKNHYPATGGSSLLMLGETPTEKTEYCELPLLYRGVNSSSSNNNGNNNSNNNNNNATSMIVLKEPINAWSNIGYSIGGSLAFGIGVSDAIRLLCHCRKRQQRSSSASYNTPGLLKSSPEFSILIGLSWLGLGVSSFLFHSVPTRTWQQWDITFTCSSVACLIAWSLCSFLLQLTVRVAGIVPKTAAAAAAAAPTDDRALAIPDTNNKHDNDDDKNNIKAEIMSVVDKEQEVDRGSFVNVVFALVVAIRLLFVVGLIVAEAMFYVHKWNYSSTTVLMSLIAVLMGLEILRHVLGWRCMRFCRCRQQKHPQQQFQTKRYKLYLDTVAFFFAVLGFVFRQLEADKKWWNRPLCLYSTWFSPHAVFHLAGSVSLLCVYIGFRFFCTTVRVVVVDYDNGPDGNHNDISFLEGGNDCLKLEKHNEP